MMVAGHDGVSRSCFRRWKPAGLARACTSCRTRVPPRVALASRQNPTSHLDISYWSTTPYLFGAGRAVKYVARPTQPHDARCPQPLTDTYLRDAPGSPPRAQDATLRLHGPVSDRRQDDADRGRSQSNGSEQDSPYRAGGAYPNPEADVETQGPSGPDAAAFASRCLQSLELPGRSPAARQLQSRPAGHLPRHGRVRDDAQSVFRYSMIASRSAAGRSVPYRCPPLPLPRSDVSNLTPPCSASGPVDDEPDAVPVVDVVAAVEHRRPLVRKHQRTQRRHRAVVQVRRAQPDAVERHVRVAVGLAEVAEPPRIALPIVFILPASSGVNDCSRSGSVPISSISTTCPTLRRCRCRGSWSRRPDRPAGRDRPAPVASALGGYSGGRRSRIQSSIRLQRRDVERFGRRAGADRRALVPLLAPSRCSRPSAATALAARAGSRATAGRRCRPCRPRRYRGRAAACTG